MDICSEKMISGWLICQSVRNNLPAAPLHPWHWATRMALGYTHGIGLHTWHWATRIWQRVHIDC